MPHPSSAPSGTGTSAPFRLAAWLALGSMALPSAGADPRFFDPRERTSVPRRLSQTGIYADILAKVPDTALKYFEVNAALWSDGASKQRWIVLPPGRKITYVDTTDRFDYPDSTFFVKNFLLERIEGDSSTRVPWETRLLVNRKDVEGRNAWYGFSYRWNAAGTDADLVDPDFGADTVFYYRPRGSSGNQSYKKWHFPNQAECQVCHLAREVLGFFPAQLKGPAPEQPSLDQVRALFRQGVFQGVPPDSAQGAMRWKGIREPIPQGLTADRRLAYLDTVARSYLAANCSGCHGDRGIAMHMAPAHVNFDFHTLRPAQELAHVATYTSAIEIEDTTVTALFGRRYFVAAAVRAGLDTAVGSAWNMARPPVPAEPVLLYPGYPAYSTLLYRQLVRKAPWRDSSDTREFLVNSQDGPGWLPWIFSQPWGSEAWRETLATHGLDPNSLYGYTKDIGQSGGQMPPLTTSFLPDREALQLLGEWVKTYRVLPTGLRSPAPRPEAGPTRPGAGPLTVRGRVISLAGARDEGVLLDLRGHRWKLVSVGEGQYLLPGTVAPGIHVLQVGTDRRRFLVP